MMNGSTQLQLFAPTIEAPPPKIGPAAVVGRPNSKVLQPGRGMIAAFDYTLNPYIGCSFGCSYCFAASFVADEEKKAAWGQWVEVKQNALHELAHVDLKGKTIFMSSSTDPYQPLELQTGLTRSIVEFLTAPFRQPRLTVQTRSPIVARDIDLLKRFKKVRINMSITTDSEETRKLYEPKCASIDRRFEALEEAVRSGLPVAVCVSPLLPIENPKAFARRIIDLKPIAVPIGRFHISDRPFSSTTRTEALQISHDIGWNVNEQERTRDELRRWLRSYGYEGNGWGPY